MAIAAEQLAQSPDQEDQTRKRVLTGMTVGSFALDGAGLVAGIVTLNPILIGGATASLAIDKLQWDERDKSIDQKSRINPDRWLWPHIWKPKGSNRFTQTSSRMATAAA